MESEISIPIPYTLKILIPIPIPYDMRRFLVFLDLIAKTFYIALYMDTAYSGIEYGMIYFLY